MGWPILAAFGLSLEHQVQLFLSSQKSLTMICLESATVALRGSAYIMSLAPLGFPRVFSNQLLAFLHGETDWKRTVEPGSTSVVAGRLDMKPLQG